MVVPARDVADYVGDVLDDLRGQRFGDFEALLVDDRSNDDTRRLLERHAEADDRFHLLEAGGDGPSGARNLALDHARGEWLAFVDADDRISTDYLATMHAAQQDSGAEVVVANARRLYGGRTRASRLHLRACARPARGLTLAERPELVWDVTVWNKLIRRRLWEDDGLRFAPGRWINDVYPSLRTHVLARQVDVLDTVLYYWRERSAADSITSSKFHDPAARRKSLSDRRYAITSTQQMLAAAAVPAAVQARFEERLLLHDLWTYLPLYHDGDRHYRRELFGLVEDVLHSLTTSLDDHALGPLLFAAYRAVLAGDRDTLARVLAPDAQVSALATEGAIHHRFAPGAPPDTTLVDRVRARRTTPLPATTAPAERLSVEARIEGVRLSSGDPPQVQASGHLRIRDGASDLDGAWQASVWLTAVGNRARTGRSTAALAPLPTDARHPLRRSGWRAFTVTLPLSELGSDRDLDRWTLQVGAELDGVHHRAERTVAGYVEPTLAVGTALTDDLDVFPRIDRNSQVQFRLADARVRVVAAHPDGPGSSVLVHLAPGSRVAALWLQEPEGGVCSRASVGRDGYARLALPVLGSPGATLQLWAATPTGPLRPRPTARLRTAVLRQTADAEQVLRPTLGGRLVVETRVPRLTLSRSWTGDDSLQVTGPPPATALDHVDRLVLESVWSTASIEVQIQRAPGRWHASVPLAPLTAGSSGFDTAWTWRLLAPDGEGATVPVRTAVTHRNTLPLREVTRAAEVELRLGAHGAPRLLVGAPPPTAPDPTPTATGTVPH